MAVTLVSPDDQLRFVKIERFLKKTVEVEPVPAHILSLGDGPTSGRSDNRRGGNDRNRRPERGENRRPERGDNRRGSGSGDRRDGQSRGPKPASHHAGSQEQGVSNAENQAPKVDRPAFKINKAVTEIGDKVD